MGKVWYKSKTMIVNLCFAVMAFLPDLINLFTAGGMDTYIPEGYRWIIGLLAVVNLVLRAVTTEPVHVRNDS